MVEWYMWYAVHMRFCSLSIFFTIILYVLHTASSKIIAKKCPHKTAYLYLHLISILLSLRRRRLVGAGSFFFLYRRTSQHLVLFFIFYCTQCSRSFGSHFYVNIKMSFKTSILDRVWKWGNHLYMLCTYL